jgi:hypothetical protein
MAYALLKEDQNFPQPQPLPSAGRRPNAYSSLKAQPTVVPLVPVAEAPAPTSEMGSDMGAPVAAMTGGISEFFAGFKSEPKVGANPAHSRIAQRHGAQPQSLAQAYRRLGVSQPAPMFG